MLNRLRTPEQLEDTEFRSERPGFRVQNRMYYPSGCKGRTGYERILG